MTSPGIKMVLDVLKKGRFSLNDEMELQRQMEEHLKKCLPQQVKIIRSYKLSNDSIIDFLLQGLSGNIGVEVKIKGTKKRIYQQCERYCSFDEIHTLILVTNFSMGFPQEINGRPCYLVKLGAAWL